jgi:hypothetical protein
VLISVHESEGTGRLLLLLLVVVAMVVLAHAAAAAGRWDSLVDGALTGV